MQYTVSWPPTVRKKCLQLWQRRGTTPRSRWISTKQAWITGEVFEAAFPLPNAAFQLDLKAGELLVYLYLHF